MIQLLVIDKVKLSWFYMLINNSLRGGTNTQSETIIGKRTAITENKCQYVSTFRKL